MGMWVNSGSCWAMLRQTDRQTDSQPGRQTGKQADRQAASQADRPREKERERERHSSCLVGMASIRSADRLGPGRL